ncbi:hypothetical protein M422DRAFT_22926 [Sphaerobolus stellatus SS14]|nr:hypothetical protein M422DRAFT_22926 [Sphaerobolus stellatus SS14]
MHIAELLRRDGCDLSSCPKAQCPGPCNTQTQDCAIVAPACPTTCATVRCDAKSPGSSGGGTSPGALAGAIIGALLFLALVILGYIYYRRREAAKEAAAKQQENVDVKPDIPARADAVLSRPDPHFAARASSTNSAEKTFSDTGATEFGDIRVYSNQSDSTINLDPSQPLQSSAVSSRSNPFTDKLSIQTASERSQSTNVIPIALVTPPQNVNNPPVRPPRPEGDLLGEELDIRLPYATSARSGISGKSFMTTSSMASDFDEAPQIVTPTQGVVRQVLGVAPAQVVRVPSNGSGTKARNARGAALIRQASKATVGRSPLAQQSFTSDDIPEQRASSPTSSRADPFTDSASPNNRESFADSARTTDTFGTPNYHSEGPFTPRPGGTFGRPASIGSTVDGFSIRADIGTASRVILGLQSAPATAVSPGFSQSGLSPGYSPGFSQSRATSMQTNATRSIMGHEDDIDSVRPYSMASHKTSSSRADSVLAAFPFVPPSPISALPPRSPGGATSPAMSPGSGGSTFAKQQSQALATPLPNSPPMSPRSTTTTQGSLSPNSIIGRQTSKAASNARGTSTLSAASSGLETYPFQFGDEPPSASVSVPRSRASLDTLKIAQDLAAFPLEHDGYPQANKRR